MNGVLVVDKPAGPTSFDVVARVRSLLKIKKVGHTGTLDPMATGVLPLCLGDATKIAGFITEGDKAYDAVIALGKETDTQDAMGKVTAEAPAPTFSREQLEAALDNFRGTFPQLPPMYSAIKIAGRRLYELARAGQDIPREAREVTVYTLTLQTHTQSALTVSVKCSKGFFVRTLAYDLGRVLGCGAHLQALRRTQSGPFSLAQAQPLEGVQGARLVGMNDALIDLPEVRVSAAEATAVMHGRQLESQVTGRVRVVDASGELLAVAEGQAGRLKYLRVLKGGA
ncbi:MAG: tRNA pseudouridine(55) synthase TruB [Myxococcaceae bacterium]